jgi:hypothetical protein
LDLKRKDVKAKTTEIEMTLVVLFHAVPRSDRDLGSRTRTAVSAGSSELSLKSKRWSGRSTASTCEWQMAFQTLHG